MRLQADTPKGIECASQDLLAWSDRRVLLPEGKFILFRKFVDA